MTVGQVQRVVAAGAAVLAGAGVIVLGAERLKEAPLSWLVASAFMVGIAALDVWMYVRLLRTRAMAVLAGGFLLFMLGWVAFVPEDDGLEFLGLFYPVFVTALAAVVEALLDRRPAP